MDAPFPPLTAAEARVLGALVEKQLTTPDYYPLTLHTLTAACNQLTNREPVVAYDEPTVVRALDGLRERRLATLFHGAESRVPKYRHTLPEALSLPPADVALLCVLLLRGPQTLGELRARTERLHAFATLAAVEESLHALIGRQPLPLVAKLPRLPGTKEPRYAHLLSGPVDPATTEPAIRPEPATLQVRAENERLARLEEETARLRTDLADLQRQFSEFRRQFD